MKKVNWIKALGYLFSALGFVGSHFLGKAGKNEQNALIKEEVKKEVANQLKNQ